MASNTPRIDALYARHNFIINGDFRFWQRGTSLALDGNNTYLADRFAAFANMTGFVGTQTRDASVPTFEQAGCQLAFSHKMTATTGATADSNNASIVFQRIEGYNYAPLHGGKEICLQFWVRASKTGVMGINFSNGTNTRRYVTSVTILAANVWELKQVNLETDTTGTWAFTNAAALNVGFMLDAAGTRLTSTLNQWHVPAVTSFQAPTNQTHFLSANNDYVQLAGIQLVEGNYSGQIPFAAPNVSEELLMCQRYYEKSYNITTDPGSNTVTGRHIQVDLAQNATTTLGVKVPYKSPKRASPTITVWPFDGSPSGSWIYGTGNTEAVTTLFESSENEFGIFFNGTAAGLTAGAGVKVQGQWAADAEL